MINNPFMEWGSVKQILLGGTVLLERLLWKMKWKSCGRDKS